MSRVVLAMTFALTACAGTGSMPNENQPNCKLPTTNEWLKRDRANWNEFVPVDASLIYQISNDLPSAIRLLANEGAVQISSNQVRRFTGEPLIEEPVGRTAYLIRAVFPTRRPSVSVGWYQDDLEVFAGGLGCARYEKHAIIVYLDRRPVTVFVGASAAL